MIARRARPKRSAGVKRKKRGKSERERIYGPKGYVEWVHEQPCVGCGIIGFSECAHIKTGGTGRKADWVLTVPLCGNQPIGQGEWLRSGCHEAFHGWGRKTFEQVMLVDLDVEARRNHEAWQSYTNGEK